MKNMIQYGKRILFPIILLMMAAGFSRCSDDEPNIEKGVKLQKTQVEYNDTSQFLDVNATGAWTLSIRYDFDEEEAPYQWCYIDEADLSGNGSRHNIILRYDENPYGVAREAYIILRTDGQTYEAKLTQDGNNPGTTTSIKLSKGTVYANEVSQFIRVYTNGEWTIELQYEEGGQTGWASVEPSSGVGIQNDVVLSYSRNESGATRSVTLVLKSQGKEVTATLTQSGEYVELLDIELTAGEVEATETEQKVNVQAEGDWTVALQYPSGTSAWAAISASNGTDNQVLTLTYSQNTSEDDRQVTLVLTSSVTGNQRSVTLTQKGRPATPVDSGWMELPSMSNMGSNEVFVTHSATISGRSMRNYSMLYDTNERIAYWVAYPHHSIYLGSQKRTDAWQYDPKVPNSQQANLSRSYVDNDYDRGHQLPSGDRTANYESNAQTFYYTNMTPQRGTRFNQSLWANLESKVRGYLSGTDRPDTLYVVTGAILKTRGGNETVNYATDRSGNKIAKPNYYFKVLLHRRNDNYRSIGFWYVHQDYTRTQPSREDVKSVRQIEELTGYDFFPTLPESVRDQVETTVTYSAWDL